MVAPRPAEPLLRTIEELEHLDAEPQPHPVLAIGIFDGLHRGHQAILREVVKRSRQLSGTPMLLTFHPHPQKVISSGDAPLLLQTRRQKEEMLSELGIRVLIRLPFTRRLSLLSPEEFAGQILQRHGFREIHVGSNFRFGHRRSGDFATLKDLGQKYRFEVRETKPIFYRSNRISSTAIRRLLSEGNPSMARRLLGRPYQMRGTVVRGRRLGIKIGFPTANLDPENELIPATGVYVTLATVNGVPKPSVTNVGFRPTVAASLARRPVVEAHLLDCSDDLYGKPLALDFLIRIRGEKKFGGIDELRVQIARDVSRTRTFFRRTAARADRVQTAAANRSEVP